MTYTELEDMIVMRLGGRAVVNKYYPIQEGEIPKSVKRALRKILEMIDPTFESLLRPFEAKIIGDGIAEKFNIYDIIDEGVEWLRAKSLKRGNDIVIYTTKSLVDKVDKDELTQGQTKTFIYGNYIYIYPILGQNEEAILNYYAYPPDVDENGRSVPDLSYVPPSYHEAIGYYAIWDLGHKLATLSNYDPTYYLNLFRMAFQEAQKGLNEGFTDNIPHIVNIYNYEDNL